MYFRKKALKSVYFTLVHSHLVYCIQIWSCCPPSNLTALFKKQKIAIRLINHSKYNSHTESLFKSCEILPLPTLTDYFKLQFMYQFLNDKLPQSFGNIWSTNQERRNQPIQDLIHEHLVDILPSPPPLLRNQNELFVPFSRLVLTDRFPLTYYPKLWSNFNLQIPGLKYFPTKIIFNKKLRAFFLESLQADYVCERMLCPHCHLGR